MITPALTSVFVRDLCLFGYHGVLPEETRIGQRFVVDIEIRADLSGAIAGDDYEQAVCYGTLCDIASAIVTGPPLQLIETVAGRIAEAVLAKLERVEWVRVEVRKPSAPVPYAVSGTAVSVEQVRVHEVAFSLGSNLGSVRLFWRRRWIGCRWWTGWRLGKSRRCMTARPGAGGAADVCEYLRYRPDNAGASRASAGLQGDRGRSGSCAGCALGRAGC